MAFSQPDLFAELAPAANPRAVAFGLTPDLVGRIRAEPNATPALARAAEPPPWPDLTRAAPAEPRSNPIARRPPDGEAAAPRRAFGAEVARVRSAEDRGW